MPRQRLTAQDLEATTRLAWVLLAVDRFGSFGGYAREGEALLKAGLIISDDDAFRVTDEGDKWVQRIHASR